MPDAPEQSLPDEAGLTAAVNAAVILHGVPMAPEWRDAVVFNFSTMAAAAGLVMALPLDDEIETAPVFRA